MTNATPDGGAVDTGGEVGVAGGVLEAGRSLDGRAFGEGVSLRAGTGTPTEATVVGVTGAVAVGTIIVVGDGDAEGPRALRCRVQPGRATSAATSAATTAQRPARSCTMPPTASLLAHRGCLPTIIPAVTTTTARRGKLGGGVER
jgi:hypothetical protein